MFLGSDRRQRACVAASHALRNEQWNKSQFAWDADARSDIFGQIKDDPLLDMYGWRQSRTASNFTDTVNTEISANTAPIWQRLIR